MRARKLIVGGMIAAWFLYITRHTLGVPFAPDDPMNLNLYWRLTPGELLFAQIAIWGKVLRPMAGLFYAPMFSAFGLNPAPFHAALLGLLLFTTYLVYRTAVLLGAGEPAAALAAFLAAYHSELANLTYNIAFSYDVLCGCFYFGAMVYYLRIREAGRRLAGREIAVFLALYLCALNSKEMAVTLPAVLLAYEFLYHGRKLAWTGPAAAGCLTAAHLLGKVFAPGKLASDLGYQTSFTWATFAEFQSRSWAALLFEPPSLPLVAVVCIWVALTGLAFRRPSPVLRLCWAMLVVTPLPIEFLAVGRGGGCLYIPYVAGAIFAGVVVVDTLRAIAGRGRLSAALFAAFVLLWCARNDARRRYSVFGYMEALGPVTASAIAQMKALAPRTSPHSTVVFLNDPFGNWDMSYIAELWFRDRTLRVLLNRQAPVSADELARAERVFDYRDGRLVIVR